MRRDGVREPAHRLAFGTGVITWEYIDGIRSWLLPSVIAAIMRAEPEKGGKVVRFYTGQAPR